MRLRYPSYYNNFHCLGTQCKDNCCIGWEIDIDEQTLEKYRNIKGCMGKRLRCAIAKHDSAHFILDEEKRCPFLNQDNLCDIILSIGEENLCTICAEHPRFNNWFGNLKETGIGLCCEEAVHLLFLSDEPIAFIEEETADIEEADKIDKEVFSILDYARNAAFDIVQNRELDIIRRMILLITFTQDLQKMLDAEDWAGAVGIVDIFRDRENYDEVFSALSQLQEESTDFLTLAKEIIGVYQSMEVLDERWKMLLIETEDRMEANIVENIFPSVLSKNDLAIFIEHLLVYFLFRYYLMAYYDGDVAAKVNIAISCVILLCILQCFLCQSKEEEVLTWGDLVKMYAKEIEYSEENLKSLQEAYWTEPCFRLAAYLKIFTFTG